MTKKNKLTIASLFAVTGISALVAQVSLAQTSEGCIKLAPVVSLSVGQAVVRTCADNSGTGSAQLVSVSGSNKTFDLVANLKHQVAISASTNIVNSSGFTQCNANGTFPVDQDGKSNTFVKKTCTLPSANAGSLRVLVGDGVGP